MPRPESEIRWHEENRDHVISYQKAYRQRMKQAAINAYGGCCSCCGESNPVFLTVDHINNDGGERRKSKEDGTGSQLYAQLRKRGYPLDYQVLCWNCNCGRQVNGGICPHEE